MEANRRGGGGGEPTPPPPPPSLQHQSGSVVVGRLEMKWRPPPIDPSVTDLVAIESALRASLAFNPGRLMEYLGRFDTGADNCLERHQFLHAISLLELGAPMRVVERLFETWKSDVPGTDHVPLTELSTFLKRGGAPRRREAPRRHIEVHRDLPISQKDINLVEAELYRKHAEKVREEGFELRKRLSKLDDPWGMTLTKIDETATVGRRLRKLQNFGNLKGHANAARNMLAAEEGGGGESPTRPGGGGGGGGGGAPAAGTSPAAPGAAPAPTATERRFLLEGLYDNAEQLQSEIDLWRQEHRHLASTINSKLFFTLLNTLGLPLDSITCDEIFHYIDKAGTGYISLDDLARNIWQTAVGEMRSILGRPPPRLSKVNQKKKGGGSSPAAGAPQQSASAPAPGQARDHLRDALVQQAARVIDLFQAWDADGDGGVTKTEFKAAIPELGLWTDSGEVDELFDSFDADGSGQISFRELNRMLRRNRETDLASKGRKKTSTGPKDGLRPIELVDMGSLRKELYKKVRIDAVHADIQKQANDAMLSSIRGGPGGGGDDAADGVPPPEALPMSLRVLM